MDNNRNNNSNFVDDTLIEFNPVKEDGLDDFSALFNNNSNNENVINITQIVDKKENKPNIDVNNYNNQNISNNYTNIDIPNNNLSNNFNNFNEINNNIYNNPNYFNGNYNSNNNQNIPNNDINNSNNNYFNSDINNASKPFINPEISIDNISNLSIEKKSIHKISKYAVLLPIFAFVSTLFLGVYLFTSNIKADTNNLIRVEKNNKVGYIDSEGNMVISPKYLGGTDYYKGLAIVKNQNDLLGVINNSDSLISSFGNYFYIERFSNRYIVSKFTSNGLKLALLNTNFDELTRYKYDNLSYASNNTFVFVRDNTLGILNSKGKEIYTYESDDVDDKNISIEISKITDENIEPKYAKIKVNDSSTIVNIKNGKIIYKYTLDEINVLDNNVFYIKTKDSESNNKYIVVNNDKIVFQSDFYKRVRVDDYNSNVIIGVKENITYDYIDMKTRNVLNENNSFDYYYGDGIILKKDYDDSSNIAKFEVIKDGKVISNINNINPITGEYHNGFLKLADYDNKVYFIDENGKTINEDKYDTATNFNDFGYSIVSKDNFYGVLDSKGKLIIPINYTNIEFLDNDLFKLLKEKYKKELFIYSLNDLKGIIDKENQIKIKEKYSDFSYLTLKNPIILGNNSKEDKLINLDSNLVYDINVFEKPKIYNEYFTIGTKYYNYEGKKIYDTSKED